MINELKKAILAGIGTAATAYEKTDSFIQDMVAKGKITVEDGKVLSEDEANKSTLEEINKLKERIAVLEAKLNEEEI